MALWTDLAAGEHRSGPGDAPANGGPTTEHEPALSAGVRFERKYLLAPDEAKAVSRFLADRLEPDAHVHDHVANSYPVRSVYFDSPDFACYHAKLDGDAVRHKYRLRSYDTSASAPLRLECKSRHGQVYRKERAWLDAAMLACLRDRAVLGRNGALETPAVVRRLLYLMERRAYGPVVLVAYDREAYTEYPGQDTVRISLDRNLRARAFPELQGLHDDGLEPVLGRGAILEVKFTDVVPRTLRQLTARFPLQQRACSKYASSVAQVIAGLPSRKEGWVHARLL